MKNFRETLWFKRGELERDIPVDESRGELPVEDRYHDDDSVTSSDSIHFGVRTGTTAYMKVTFLEPKPQEPAATDWKTLVGEMKGVRGKLALVGGGMVAAFAAVALFVV
jgi:hypothetical protein